jgi:hypothetical protein
MPANIINAFKQTGLHANWDRSHGSENPQISLNLELQGVVGHGADLACEKSMGGTKSFRKSNPHHIRLDSIGIDFFRYCIDSDSSPGWYSCAKLKTAGHFPLS